MLNVIMLNAIMLNVIMLNVIMLNVVMLSVVAPRGLVLASCVVSPGQKIYDNERDKMVRNETETVKCLIQDSGSSFMT